MRKRSEVGTLAEQLSASLKERASAEGMSPASIIEAAHAMATRPAVGPMLGGEPLRVELAEKAKASPDGTFVMPGGFAGKSSIGASVPIGKSEPKKEPPPLYATAQGISGISPDFARIVEAVYAVDAWKDYEDIEKNLEVGEARGDYASLREYLDKAEVRARRAHRLYLGAKLEKAKWELDSAKVVSAMRKAATDELQLEKESGDRTKRITNDDVEAKMAEKFPDEVAAQEIARVKLSGVVDDMEHMTRRCDAKCSDLKTLLETLRK